jgi:hypothetical protein
LLVGENQPLAIDLLLLCCTTKYGARIGDWALLASKLSDALRSDSDNPKQLLLLSAVVATKCDAVTGKTFSKSVFEILTARKSDRDVGLFCQLVGKLDESFFESFLLEEFVKYVPGRWHAHSLGTSIDPRKTNTNLLR